MFAKPNQKITRQSAVQRTGNTLAGVIGLASFSFLAGATGLPDPGDTPTLPSTPVNPNFTQKLRIAAFHFPVSFSPLKNAEFSREFVQVGGPRGSTPAADVGSESVGICRMQHPYIREI